MNPRPLKPPEVRRAAGPPPLPRRIRLKLRRIYLDLTGPALDREWRRVWPLIDAVPGYLLPGQEYWLFQAAYSLPGAANIVEIGSFKGRSTCCLAFGCRGTKKRVFAVDVFGGNEYAELAPAYLHEFQTNVERCGVTQHVQPVIGASHQIARTWNQPIHLLFIDGSHEHEDVLADFKGFFPHVVPGGIVAFHDVCDEWPGPLRVWKENAKAQLTGMGNVGSLAYGRKRA